MNAHTGHNWVVTAAAKNLCIKCTVCSLYAQQVDPNEVVDLVLSHPCKRRPAEPFTTAGIHPSHLTLNLGHQWSCSRCKAHHSVRTRAKGPLSKECKGDRKRGTEAFFSDSEFPESQRPPNPETQRPKTTVPPLFLARDSPSHSPEELSVGVEDSWSNQVPTKSKGKAKAKPKANSVAGLLSVASFFKTNHSYQMQWGDGQNKGPPRSEEEVNAARGLSVRDLSRSTRALAHRASIDSKFIPGVRPPPPPKAPTRALVVLLEAQPRSGGSSPQHDGPKRTCCPSKLRRPWMRHLPRTAASKGPSTQRRCQLLRVSLPSKFWSKSGPTVWAKVRIREQSRVVLPKDKRELEATSSGQSTESDEGGAVLASSSTTPWQRRFVLLKVLVTWVWLRQANTPLGLDARRVEARQSYMVGSNLVCPSP